MCISLLIPFELRGFVPLLLLERALCLGGNLSERFRLMNGQIGKHFAIELDRRQFQSMHELRIIQTVQASSSSDAHDPETAKIALLQLPSGVSEIQPALDRLFCR